MNIDIAPIIQRFRELNPMTQQEMAELSGLSVRSISDFERGITIPSKLSWAKLLKAFPEMRHYAEQYADIDAA